MGAGLIGVWYADLRSRQVRDLALFGEHVRQVAVFYDGLVVPGALLLLGSGTWLIVTVYGGWAFLRMPWLSGMVALFAFEFIEGNTLTRRYFMRLRRLTRTIGGGRDMDVTLGLYQDRLESLRTTSAEQRALLSRLRAARARSRSQVAEGVFDLDIDGLRRSLRRLLQEGAADSNTVLARARAFRESQGASLLRRFFPLLTSKHAITVNGQQVAYIKQRFRWFNKEFDVEMSPGSTDPRFVLACALLALIAEARREDAR